jgi:hypothetical protein
MIFFSSLKEVFFFAPGNEGKGLSKEGTSGENWGDIIGLRG